VALAFTSRHQAEPGPNSRRAEPAANSRIGWVSGLGFYLAEPSLSEEKIKVLVKLFQKLVVSKGKAFGRAPQRSKYFYRSSAF